MRPVTLPRNVLAWASAYFFVAVAPLGVILAGPVAPGRGLFAPDRGFWVEFAVGLGSIGLAMLCLQSIPTARLPRVSAAFGHDALLQFHRQAGIVAFVFIYVHPVILLMAKPRYLSFLDPRVDLLRAGELGFGLVALLMLVGSLTWRRVLQLSYGWWRLAHGVLAVAILAIGMDHILDVRYYLSNPWTQLVWATLTGGAILSVAHVRLVKPLTLRRRPYRVVAVQREALGIWTVSVEPETERSLRFRAGQFASLILDDGPFSLRQRPLSIASSAHGGPHLDFTIKALGDSTGRISGMQVGTRAYVDGPYGALTLPGDPRAGLMLIAGGIGITPIMSMLRTLHDEGHRAPIVLIDANDRQEDIVFSDELERLATDEAFDLRLVHVLAQPPAGWRGETGSVTAELIARHLPERALGSWHFILCGPPPMMGSVEGWLLRLGVPSGRIACERFDTGATAAIGRGGTRVSHLVLALAVAMVVAAALFAR
jgi:3-phenylpropionate/trans-cinnamate dioxygenase ferredoxin reductase subunit